jgi:branched-chain amino acid transport system substrate-binding protein
MKLDRRTFLAGTAATLSMPVTIDFASAEEKVIRFAMPQDFTRVYTFVTAEYSQGQRDYITLVNERGGINGYRIVADVSDHGNDLPRAIEAYEKAKREGAVLIDPLSTPVARALVPRALEDKINMVTAFSGRRLRVPGVPLHPSGQRPVRDLAAGAACAPGLGDVLGRRRRPDGGDERSRP